MCGWDGRCRCAVYCCQIVCSALCFASLFRSVLLYFAFPYRNMLTIRCLTPLRRTVLCLTLLKHNYILPHSCTTVLCLTLLKRIVLYSAELHIAVGFPWCLPPPLLMPSLTNPAFHRFLNPIFQAILHLSHLILEMQAGTICGTFVQHKSGLKIFVLVVFTFRDKL